MSVYHPICYLKCCSSLLYCDCGGEMSLSLTKSSYYYNIMDCWCYCVLVCTSYCITMAVLSHAAHVIQYYVPPLLLVVAPY